MKLLNKQIRTNFKYSELCCPCCLNLPLNDAAELFLDKLQTMRDNLKKPIFVTSGYRCMMHNLSKEVQGDIKSDHLTMTAVDVICDNSKSAYELIKGGFAVGFNHFVYNAGRKYLHMALTKNPDFIERIQIK